MRFFALETDVGKIKRRYSSEHEREILFTRYHGLSFLFAIFREILITLILIAIGIGASYLGLPMSYVIGVLVLVWIIFAFFNFLKSYLDWLYDFIFVTTDKVVLVNQTSVFRQEIRPIHLENIGSVSSNTQYWNIFNFGAIAINLKEGIGDEVVRLKYVPNASEVAAKIADVVTSFQRGGGTPTPKPTPKMQGT